MFLFEIPQDWIHDSGKCKRELKANISTKQRLDLFGQYTNVPGL